MNETVTVGLNLWRLRTEAGLTREELAETSGISVSAIRRIEDMKNDIRVSTLAALANALEVDICSFFDAQCNAPLASGTKAADECALKKLLYPECPVHSHIYSLRHFLVYLPLFDR